MTLVCGIDEAGRGPLIGSMVMAGVLVDQEGSAALKSIGVKDSKLLSQKKRVELFGKIVGIAKAHSIIVVEPKEIDAALESESLNLNWLEATTTAKILNELSPDTAIVDCPSNNISNYSNYLRKLLKKDMKLVVEHKADTNYVEAAAASILAKVTREAEISKLKKKFGDFGSGYLTDPKTIKFLDGFGLVHSGIFRKSWAPYRKKFPSGGQRSINDFEVRNNGE